MTCSTIVSTSHSLCINRPSVLPGLIAEHHLEQMEQICADQIRITHEPGLRRCRRYHPSGMTSVQMNGYWFGPIGVVARVRAGSVVQ